MKVHATHDLLNDLGFGRVIWIDDFFEASLDRIKDSLLRDSSPLFDLNLPGFEEAIEFADDDDNLDRYEDLLIQALNGAEDSGLMALNAAIRDRAAKQENVQSDVPSPDKDLSSETIISACKMLGVKEEDRLGFEAGLARLETLNSDPTQNVSFVVDLQDAFQAQGIGAAAGVNVLKKIYAREKLETVFVLTHETEAAAEATKEKEIAQQLGGDLASKPVPCVISKDRISVSSEEDLAEGIQVALKRASLRQEVYRVGQAAEERAASAIAAAREKMCTIPPEELDGFFVRRAIKDGASDLHMIERIYSAQVTNSVRSMFVENEDVKTAVSRMRLLRNVPLQAPNDTGHPVIIKFRHDEIWHDQAFLKASYAPISLGDVFQTMDDAKRQFILLGQLCDITLRDNGSRAIFSSDFVQFKTVQTAEEKLKTLDLKIGENGGFMRFDFNKKSPVNLSILDLASMNEDGEVRISSDQKPLDGVLPGQAKGFTKTLKQLNAILGDDSAKADDVLKANSRCQLTMQIDNPFNGIAKPTSKTKDGVTELRWNLVRTGRLCSPYIDQLMDRQLMLAGRRALDIDYLPHG